MQPIKHRSLRDKIIGAFGLPTLVTILVYGVMAYATARSGLEDELGQRLVGIGQTIAADFGRGVEAGQLERLDASKTRTRERLRARLEGIRDDTGARRVFLFDPALGSLVDTDPAVDFGQRLFALEADRFEIEDAFASGRATTSVLFTDTDGTPYKTAYVPIRRRDEQGAPGPVVAAVGVEASASFLDLLTNFASALLLVGLLCVGLIVGLGAIVARRITSPVEDLVDAAQALERGEFDRPVVAPDALEERKRGDELARLSASFEEMRRAILGRDRQMQMMLSGIAHEVRNPLGGMELFCGLLEEDLQWEDPPDPKKLDKVARIQRELVYLNKVVTDFLDFARHRPLERERFGARELLDEVARLQASDAEAHGCALEVEVEPEELEITGDRERLRRAILNTTRNAWQASPDGGTITLSAHAISREAADWRVLAVRDQGQGIPAARLGEILTPFFTTREKGSGLGLALTQKVVEQHGGEMTIESTEGEGTTVRFALPFDPDAALAAPQAAEIPEGWLG